ncbi:MAG: isoleucine--tRNA ligase [Candidatus Omnitrophica bacterium]|nr:isoleucine--tRNA ligase [Candidatus Omnitrophota bacterium]
MEYKTTLNLPKTDFPMKADLPAREPVWLAQWEAAGLYQAIQESRRDAEAFILHDGPPYANGDIHIGHALNKILKDLILRYKTMQGYRTPYVPGWDCHGMPIEHQLFKELKQTKQQIEQQHGQVEFRQKARAYAERYVGIQREQFQRLGILGDWAQPYLTMAPAYELTILKTFLELLKAGYIYRGKKPVHWCATCETALAEAEVEYEDRKDTSIYVKFPVVRPPKVRAEFFKQPVAVVAWTTTPWTLPANVALCFHPQAEYVLLEGPPHLLVASELAERFTALLNTVNVRRVGTITGKELEGLRCQTPFSDRESVAVTDDSVSLDEGTGVVHIAPGHGQEDYLIGQRYKLPTLSPVDHQGRFTREVPQQFAGQLVFEANQAIIDDLRMRGLLLKEEPITHSYPHCWRCKKPVIFRATPQWFLSVEQQDLRSRLLGSARKVKWIPETGISRMTGMLETRPDWCLSRQRYWGSPIPILHCAACGKPVGKGEQIDAQVVERILKTLEARGAEAWFTMPAEELGAGTACPDCGGTALRKDPDILDVWFDSGVSHEAVLRQRPELAWPATMYLEGSDQHRGWFQVSLITSTALRGSAPYTHVLTHGFVMDGEGRKMSKSEGNVVSPQDVMKQYGADILRLWVASCDYREDVRISPPILEQVAEIYRKIRNTFRYLLANLQDFDPARDRQLASAMPELDRWALHRAQALLEEVTKSYEDYQFHQAARALYHYCVVELSSCYLDALKDRLYTEAAGSPARRCAQTVLYAILHALARLTAPVLSLTADEVWQLMRAKGLADEPSVHMARWPADIVPAAERDADLLARWEQFLSVRDEVMKALEAQRAAGVIGSPLEARVTLVTPDARLQRTWDGHRADLAEACVVSDLAVQLGSGAAGPAGLSQVIVERAPGTKCQRCWKFQSSVGANAAHPQLCARCAGVIATMASR